MNLADLFIRRPVMTTLLMSGILLFGVMGYRSLPVSDLPNVDYPTLLVGATLPGASPETIASSIALPLERQFSNIAGLDSMSSSSILGSTQITLQFNLSRNIDAAAQDVQAAIAKTGSQLPQGMPSPPSYVKVNPADQPILYLACCSPTLPLSTVNEYAETMLAQRISMLPGVAQVGVSGSQKYAVRVKLNPEALASRGIGIDEAVAAIQKGNVELPTGTLNGPHQAFTLQASGQLTRAEAYRPLIVAYRNGSPVRLEELGQVMDGVENDKVASWMNNTRGIILSVMRQPGTNTVEVADAVSNLIPTFKAQLPASITLDMLYDRSQTIRKSVSDVKFTLLLTVGLVVMVIFLFLRNLSATIIPSLALPMSIIGTFAAMSFFGYNLDNLSLMALTLSVGFVVDDAIVVLENIVRHIENGEKPFDAAVRGAREIFFTILSMTLSLAAVFLPVLFMGGILGRLFHEFAVTISCSILVSGFVSLTLTPMLCSRFLRGKRVNKLDRADKGDRVELSRHGNWMSRFYGWTLRGVLRVPSLILLLSILLLAATVQMFRIIPKGFIPSEDTDQAFIATEGVQGISFDSLVEHQQALAALIAGDPNVVTYSSNLGSGSSSVSSYANSGRIFLHLKPRPERKIDIDSYIQELRKRLAVVPGMRVFIQNPPLIRIGGMISKGQYQYTLQGPDTQELYKQATLLEGKLRELPQLQDVTTDLQIANPQVDVQIDRDKASTLGLTATQIEEALYSAYGTRQISTIYAPNNQYRVIVELDRPYQTDPSVLSMLYVRSSNGRLVPLDSVAKLTRSLGPLSVSHNGQLPAVTLSFNLKPGVALGDAVEAVRRVARATLPATISTTFQGTAQAFQSSLAGLWMLLLLSILVIYLVLGILYESFFHPITILSGLPSAGLGALLTLYLFKTDLNIYSFVGVIMLVGIVKKNAIMMIDFAIEAQRNEGLSPAEAIYEGCLIRFRPIMMTTMAALAGTLPIALGIGAGAESRRPLGLAVVGGLVVSQFLTLYITPVIYLYLEALRQKMTRRSAAETLRSVRADHAPNPS